MEIAKKLSRTTVILHWVVGLTVIGLLVLGFYMTNTEAYGLYPIHKSIGVLIFAVILLRVFNRIRRGWLSPVRAYSKAEQVLARGVHWALVLATLAMPLTGMINSAANGHGLGVFGWMIVPKNPDPTNPAQVVAYSEGWAEFGHETHELVGYILAGAVILHVLAALKHHFLDNDRTLLRMMGR